MGISMIPFHITVSSSLELKIGLLSKWSVKLESATFLLLGCSIVFSVLEEQGGYKQMTFKMWHWRHMQTTEKPIYVVANSSLCLFMLAFPGKFEIIKIKFVLILIYISKKKCVTDLSSLKKKW